MYCNAPPPYDEKRRRYPLGARERFRTQWLHVVWMPQGNWSGPSARPMWGVCARVWAQPRGWLGLGNWYVNITRGERCYVYLVSQEHRASLPSEVSARVWKAGGRQGERRAPPISMRVCLHSLLSPRASMRRLPLL